MTVEEYLRSLVQGLDLQDTVVARAARSPIEIGLDRLTLTEDVDYVYGEDGEVVSDRSKDEAFQKRLDYASSTIYYSVLGVFAGGGYSEQVGDVRASRGGYTITMADALRLKWGLDVEEDESSSEMYDASYLRSK